MQERGRDPRPRAGETDSRPIQIVIQLLEGAGRQLPFPLRPGGSLLLCGGASSVTHRPEACLAPTPNASHCTPGPALVPSQAKEEHRVGLGAMSCQRLARAGAKEEARSANSGETPKWGVGEDLQTWGGGA